MSTGSICWCGHVKKSKNHDKITKSLVLGKLTGGKKRETIMVACLDGYIFFSKS